MHKYEITLVHGTFAPHAEWVQRGSDFRKRLAAAVTRASDGSPGDPSKCKFNIIQWSGRNNFSARRAGADKLTSVVKAAIQARPGVRHYVIGHSHGGMVAVYAMKDPDLEKKISGVCCLSTPFLAVRPRQIGLAFTGTFRAFAISAAILSGFLTSLVIAIGRWLPRRPSVTFDQSLSHATQWWIGGVITFLVGAFLIGSRDAVRSHILGVYQRVSVPLSAHLNLLIIRASGDEASGALAVAQMMDWFITRSWLATDRCSKALARWISWPATKVAFHGGSAVWCLFVGTVICAVCGAIGSAVMGWDPANGFARPAAIGFLLFFPLIWFILFRFVLKRTPNLVDGLITLSTAPLALILGILLLPFGPELSLCSLFLEMSPETTPEGEWLVNLLPCGDWDPEAKSTGEIFQRHCGIYDDARVINMIATWVRAGTEYDAAGQPSSAEGCSHSALALGSPHRVVS